MSEPFNIDELRKIGKAAKANPDPMNDDAFIAFTSAAFENWDALLDAAEERDRLRVVLGKCIEAMESVWDDVPAGPRWAQIDAALSEAKAALNPEAAAAAMKEGAK